MKNSEHKYIVQKEISAMKKTVLFILSSILVIMMFLSFAVSSAEYTVPYKDVKEGMWYSEAVQTMYEKNIMTGIEKDKFDPSGNITRAQFVTILYRLSGEESNEAATAGFEDVRQSDWFAPYVNWASEKELVKGYPDNTFLPNNRIQRSEMVTLLDRYISYKDIRAIPDTTAVKGFPDVPASAWYAGSLETLRVTGLIKGNSKGQFEPASSATRAEAAVLFTRFCDMMDKDSEMDTLEKPLPVIRLNTETGKDVESKEEYILTDFSLTAEDGRDIEVSEVSIRGRGNTAWRVDKKSYKLKFPSKVCLMDPAIGDTTTKDWTLISCHYDKSLVRNYLGYHMAEQFGNLEWTPYAEMVEVYLNGEYRGVYMLSEQVEVKKSRVNILDGTDDNIGFFIELDFWSTGTYNIDYFMSMNKKYTIKSDFSNEDQVIALKCHMETVYNIIKEGNEEKIRSVVDVGSAVDLYILNEIYKDVDVGSGSFFMYCKEPQGMLYFGPVWDLDGALGNTTRASTYQGLYAGYNISTSGRVGEESNLWFAALQTNSWFRELVKERWNEIKDKVTDQLNKDLEFIYANIDQFEKNFESWPILTEQLSDEPSKSLKLTSCLDKILYTEDWIKNRISWLDSCFNSSAFSDKFPADSSVLDYEVTGSTTVIDDKTKWIVPEWYNKDNVCQIYFDQIYDLCETKDGRVMIYLGGRVTMTVENMNRIILDEYMGIDTSKYTLVFDDDQFSRAKDMYGGMGSGQEIIFEFDMKLRDIETGEESETATIIFTFHKDLSLNEQFGV